MILQIPLQKINAVANTWRAQISGLSHFRIASIGGTIDQSVAAVAARITVGIVRNAQGISEAHSGSIPAGTAATTYMFGVGMNEAVDIVAGTTAKITSALPDTLYDGDGREFAVQVTVNIEGGDAATILGQPMMLIDHAFNVTKKIPPTTV